MTEPSLAVLRAHHASVLKYLNYFLEQDRRWPTQYSRLYVEKYNRMVVQAANDVNACLALKWAQ